MALLELPIIIREAGDILVEGILIEDILVSNILREGIPIGETPSIDNIPKEEDTISVKDIANKINKVIEEEIIIGSTSTI